MSDKKKILFLPFVGEFGWEVMRWCGYVRHVAKTAEVAVACRQSSRDLYYGAVDHIFEFIIEDDYDTVNSDMMRCNGIDIAHLYNEAKKKFHGFEPKIPHPMPFKEMDFNFTPHPENKRIIDELLDGIDKPVVVVAPRWRNGLYAKRNYKHWPELVDLLQEKYFVLVVGVENATQGVGCLPIWKLRTEEASDSGMAIEALRRAKYCIGQQSAIPLLSNLLGTPTIMWGHEKQRHSVDENIANTPCIFLESKNYDIDPKEIMACV